MSFGRDRLVKDWLYRATIQVQPKLVALLEILELLSEITESQSDLSSAVSEAHVNASDHERR
jgi:hypothetical protein